MQPAEVVDVADPAKPPVIGSLDLGRPATHVVLGDKQTAFVTVANALLAYDLSDATKPRLLAEVPLPGASYGDQYGLATIDGHVVVGVRLQQRTPEGVHQQLTVFDARNPRQLVEAFRMALPGGPVAGPPQPIALDGGRAMVACGGGGLVSLHLPTGTSTPLILTWMWRSSPGVRSAARPTRIPGRPQWGTRWRESDDLAPTADCSRQHHARPVDCRLRTSVLPISIGDPLRAGVVLAGAVSRYRVVEDWDLHPERICTSQRYRRRPR